MCKERPILFNGDMVNAILDGRKTQTRRVIKPQPLWVYDNRVPVKTKDADPKGAINCPYGQPGDRLWVRETWFQKGRYVIPSWPEAEPDDAVWSGSKNIQFFADGDNPESREDGRVVWRKRPSIHMPRWASRITLEIVSVRVERLRDISEADAMAEGIEFPENGTYRDYGVKPENNEGYDYCKTAVDSYRTLWEQINGSDSWGANPWVWVVEFKRVEACQ